MKNTEVIRIAIAETSVIIRTGVTHTLKRLPDLRIQPVEVASIDALRDCLRMQPPHILLVNPSFGDYFDINHYRNEFSGKGIRIVALVSSFTDTVLLSKYDETVSIFDDIETITNKIITLQNLEQQETDDNSNSLSQREKEIIVCVVKGMTNKEIAENLFLSIHTVITHRRNITKKLQIHSAAGLTIYAIVNKLVELGDIKDL